VSEAAYQAYLNGRCLQRQGNYQRASSFLRQAADAAPGFALAHAALAEMYIGMGRTGAVDAFDQAKPEAEAALRLDASNAEAHNALANALFWHDWNWSAAESAFQAAVDANPSFATAYHDQAFFLVTMGRREAGLSALRRAMALDPLSVRVNIDAGWLLLQAHRFDEAVAQARRALALEPGLREANMCIARAEALQGRGTPQDSTEPFFHAAYLALSGQNDAAMASLEQAYSAHSVMMVELNSEPAFDKLRQDPRFQALAAKMRFP
jgi:tetratricopeptide (TPR) repeat protein